MEKICSACSSRYGILADFCGYCGAELPDTELSGEFLEEKEEHNRIICTSAMGHLLQLGFKDDQRYCTACGSPLPVVH